MTVLRKLREQRGVTAISVAAATGLDQSYYSKIEMGRVVPSAETAAKIAAHFGNTISELEILYPERYAETETKVEPIEAEAI